MSRPDFDNPTAMQGVVFGVLFGLCAWVLLFGTRIPTDIHLIEHYLRRG